MFVEHKEAGEVRELDSASTLLLKAADVIERQGWCQNYIGTYHGQVCLEGALNVAAGRDPKRDLVGVVGVAAHRIRRAVGKCAYHWNDAPGRTKDEVVAKLRAVALSAV